VVQSIGSGLDAAAPDLQAEERVCGQSRSALF